MSFHMANFAKKQLAKSGLVLKTKKKTIAKKVKSAVNRLSETKMNTIANNATGGLVVLASTNPNSLLIPQITAGQAGNQRVGNRIIIKEIKLQVSINWSNMASLGRVRLVVFVDNDAPTGSSTGAIWGSVLTGSAGNEFCGLPNSTTVNRFRILRDVFLTPSQNTTQAVAGQGQRDKSILIRFKKGFLQKYIDNTNNNIVNRSIYWMVAGDLGVGNQPTIRLEGYTRYKDF